VEQYYAAIIRRAPELDEECLEVLAEVYAYHLSHNAYKTDWSRFTGGAVDPHAERLVRRTLDRLQRLSFHQNLLHRLPESVHVYVPPEPTPGTGLPVQKRPEYNKMLGLVKIKDADEDKVLALCETLQRGAAEAAAPGEGGEAGEAGEEPAAKKRRAGEAPGDEVGPGGSGVAAVKPKEEQKEEPKDDDSGGVVAVVGTDSATAAAVAAALAEPAAEEDMVAKDATPWSLLDVVALFVTAMLQNGSKTPTHLSKLLDGYRNVFTLLKPDDEEQAYDFEKVLVRCVVDFWRSSSQRVEITVDAFLQRGLLTCRSAAESILATRGFQGCDSLAVWNVINAVARKSLEQSQLARVELAMAKKLGKPEASDRCKAELDRAVQQSAEVFTIVFTGLVRNFKDAEHADDTMRKVMLQRILALGRKYQAFIKPLIDAAESRIPGVAQRPEIVEVFRLLALL